MRSSSQRSALVVRLRFASVSLAFLAGAAWALPGILVRAAYTERLPGRINAVLSGRDIHPVEHYLDLVARPRGILAMLLVTAALFLRVLERSSVRAVLGPMLTGGMTGIGALWRPSAVLVLLIGSAIRFPRLGDTSLWLDEAMIASVSLGGPSGLLARMASDSSAAPVHHLLQWAAFSAAAADAWAARLPSAVAGVGTVAALLGLHRLGIPRGVALGAAFVVAISPAHIGFSRDATQYALVVLMAVVVLAAGLAVLDEERRRRREWHALLVAALLLAPWVGYQVAMVGLAVVTGLIAISLLGDGGPSRATLRLAGVGGGALVVSSVLAYMAVGRAQMRVRDQWYLAGGYPGTSDSSLGRWTLEALDGFMAVAAGGQVTGRWSASWIEGFRQPLTEGSALGWIMLAALIVGCGDLLRRGLGPERSSLRRPDPSTAAGNLALLAAVALVVGSILAASLGLYPFGGMHQQLHAAVIVTVGSAVGLQRALAQFPPAATAPAILVTSMLLLATTLPAAPPVYAEREDIVSAVVVGVDGRAERGLDPIADEVVWVYRSARFAVRFHFPERAFSIARAGPTDLEGMRDDIVRLADSGAAALVFSQIHPHPVEGDQRRALQSLLVTDGWIVLEEIHHPNTVVLNVIAPDPSMQSPSLPGVVDTPESS